MINQLPEQERSVSQRLTKIFQETGEELYLVGGVVRDLLLGHGRADLDFATSAMPDITRKLGQRAGALGSYDVGQAFGTIGLVFPGDGDEKLQVEITTYRSEVYPTRDRRPQVAHGVSLEADLSRRDLTINAIALDALTSELIDPYRGIADLNTRTIRAVSDPSQRFDEDPLRVLRAARFAAQLEFAIEPETARAMQARADEVQRISVERIAAELNRLLVSRAPGLGLRAIDDARLMQYILPELLPMVTDDRAGGTARHKDIWDHTIKVVEQTPPRLTVRWAALLHDAAKPATRSVDQRHVVHFFGHELAGASLSRRVLRRLKQEKALQNRVATIVALHLRPSAYDEDWTDAAVRRLALEAGDAFPDLLDLAAADVTSARASRKLAAARRIAGLRAHFERLEAEHALEQLQSPLDGNALMEIFNRKPGRWIAEIKDRLRDLVIDGELELDDTEAAERLARTWIADGELQYWDS